VQSNFLGVDKSILGKKWIAKEYDERQALAISQRFDLPDVIAKALSARGINVETAESFLNPRLRDLLPDPSLLKDMDKAVDRFIFALKSNEKITVFGDYDVDGATSSALLIKYAKSIGYGLRLYIPDRMKEGYGPNSDAVRLLSKEGVNLIITVDCGVSSYEALETADEENVDVIVIDHHSAQPSLPKAVAIVNPNRLDDKTTDQLGSLAAVGVTYLFIIAVNRKLREEGFFKKIKEPNLISFLDLVALGTICDVVKLTGVNRAYVTQGLKIMTARTNVGLSALAKSANAKKEMDTYSAGFVLGPRINASGRIGKSDMGARLLSCDDESEVIGYAEKLNQLNEQRKEIESNILSQADALSFDDDAPVTFVSSDKWHAGVIGIVASRLKDKYNRPSIVISIENGIGKGSCRSIGDVDIGAAIISAHQSGILINGGGHKMAAGLTVLEEKINDFRDFINDRIGKILKSKPFIPSLIIDGIVSAKTLSPDFIKDLNRLAPFGVGNPQPQFALSNCKIVYVKIVGENHVKVIAQQGSSSINAIAFGAMDNNLGTTLLSLKGQSCHLAGYLQSNIWQGKENVQLIIKDAAMV